MKYTILTIIICVITSACIAQSSTTRYFRTQSLAKEVAQDKAKFSQTVTKNADGSTTTTFKNLEKDLILTRETYKGDEPCGDWIYQKFRGTGTLDFNFNLNYSGEPCKDSIPGIRPVDYFQDNTMLNYIAPKIDSSEITLVRFLQNNMRYPAPAREKGIQGVVYLRFTVTDSGEVENIIITKSAHISLDKEAMRVLRMLKFLHPATLNGQKTSICVELPINFKLM